MQLEDLGSLHGIEVAAELGVSSMNTQIMKMEHRVWNKFPCHTLKNIKGTTRGNGMGSVV